MFGLACGSQMGRERREVARMTLGPRILETLGLCSLDDCPKLWGFWNTLYTVQARII
jgi:hypothetical protein